MGIVDDVRIDQRGPAEEQFYPPRFRVAAHDQQIIVPKLDQLPKCFMFLESRASENIGDDFDSMICQMVSQPLRIRAVVLGRRADDLHDIDRPRQAQDRQGVVDGSDSFAASIPGDGNPIERF